MAQGNTSKIGINTIFLTIRKIITLTIAFFSTRLLLSRLGEDDFGLYGLIGSLVVLFSALRSLFSTSIQRFINAAKGTEDSSRINEIFSLGIKIHIWIVLAFIVLVEIVGILMLPHLKIPSHSSNVAFWVLQFTILATATTILTIPYDAIIIAHERFKAFSIISVTESTLKLMIILCLCFFDKGRLVIYAALYFGVTIIVRLINSLYCHKKFKQETKYKDVKDPCLLKQMTSFAGWQFLGNTGYALTNSGVNIIMNLFGGVIINAARAIAYQLFNAMYQFIGDINLSFQPQTVMCYTRGDFARFWQLFFINTKVAFISAILLVAPLYLCTPDILKIWLKDIPPHTIVFTRWIFIYMVIRSLHGPLDLIFKAKAHLKKYQITELVIMILNLPLSWIALKFGADYWVVFCVMCILEIINLVAIIIIAKNEVKFPVITYLRKIILKVILILSILSILCTTISPYLNNNHNIIQLTGIVLFTILICVIMCSFVLLSSSERHTLINKLNLKRFL